MAKRVVASQLDGYECPAPAPDRATSQKVGPPTPGLGRQPLPLAVHHQPLSEGEPSEGRATHAPPQRKPRPPDRTPPLPRPAVEPIPGAGAEGPEDLPRHGIPYHSDSFPGQLASVARKIWRLTSASSPPCGPTCSALATPTCSIHPSSGTWRASSRRATIPTAKAIVEEFCADPSKADFCTDDKIDVQDKYVGGSQAQDDIADIVRTINDAYTYVFLTHTKWVNSYDTSV